MRPRSDILNDFAAAVLAALEQSPERTGRAAGLGRAYRPRARRASCIARLAAMERRGRLWTSRFAVRILVHLREEAP